MIPPFSPAAGATYDTETNPHYYYALCVWDRGTDRPILLLTEVTRPSGQGGTQNLVMISSLHPSFCPQVLHLSVRVWPRVHFLQPSAPVY